MYVLDVFSGIGGMALGLQSAGMTINGLCEIDPFCQKLLKKHWPHVSIYQDIRELNLTSLKGKGISNIDVVSGGFPCQDISSANKEGEGINGKRSGLWKEMHRLIKEIKPRYAIIENVANLRSKGLGCVLRDLWEVGYDAQWHLISAASIGALHKRERIFIIAYRRGERVPWFQSESLSRQPAFSWCKDVGGIEGLRERSSLYTPMLCRANDGIPQRVDRLRGVGNAVVPQLAEVIGNGLMNLN